MSERNPRNLDVVSMDRDELIETTLQQVAELRREDAPIKLYRFGFLRLPFTETRLQEGNSLHLWLPDSLDCDEVPHLHNCRIESRVLAGAIKNLEWSDPQLATDGEGEYRWIKTVCSDTVCQDINMGKTANVTLQNEQALGPHEDQDAYVIPVGQFHSTTLAGNALTIIRKLDFLTDPTIPIDGLLPRGATAKTDPFDISTYNQRTAWRELDRALSDL